MRRDEFMAQRKNAVTFLPTDFESTTLSAGGVPSLLLDVRFTGQIDIPDGPRLNTTIALYAEEVQEFQQFMDRLGARVVREIRASKEA